MDFIKGLIQDFVPLAGDRKFGNDDALIAGVGLFRGRSVCILGHEKGSDTESRIRHNFGMAKPEGYRKAVRLMDLADRFDLPVISFVDTAGAYPGIGAEERGQAEAIARSTDACLALGVPNVAVVIGRHLNSPPPPLSARRPDLADLDPVLARALAKNPAERFRSCTEFARALADPSLLQQDSHPTMASPVARPPLDPTARMPVGPPQRSAGPPPAPVPADPTTSKRWLSLN